MVCISLTFHKAIVERRVKDRGGEVVRTTVPAPPAILDYNQHMGVVSWINSLGTIKQSIKTRKYWKTIFFHFIDVMVTNAFLLYRKHLPPNKHARPIDAQEILRAFE